MTALLLLFIFGAGSLTVNHMAPPSSRNQSLEDLTRGPMDVGTEAWIKTRYQHKVSEARKALADRMRMADGWARYV